MVAGVPRAVAGLMEGQRRRDGDAARGRAKELREKLATVGDDIVKDKPDMKPMWDMLTALAKKH